MTFSSIPLIVESPDIEFAQRISSQWGWEIRSPKDEDQFVLKVEDDRLKLFYLREQRLGPVSVDFLSGMMLYRRKFARGQEALARAIGLKQGFRPAVVDATAGLGRDAFVMAALGCRVYMIERCSVMAALLDDGLRRAGNDAEVGAWVGKRLSLCHADSCDALSMLPFEPDVVYLDPMFPKRRKSALVKKEMRIIHALLGESQCDDGLFTHALAVAKKRVVIKRPAYAGHLADQKPDSVVKTLNNRFDVYLRV